jgi:hypothetical protein
MEPLKSTIKFIPGIGIGYTDRDGVEWYVDFLDRDIRRMDELDESFEGVVDAYDFKWSDYGLPTKLTKKEREDA